MKELLEQENGLSDLRNYNQGVRELSEEIKVLLNYSEKPLTPDEVYSHFRTEFNKEDNFYSVDDLDYVSDALLHMKREQAVEEVAFIGDEEGKVVYRLLE